MAFVYVGAIAVIVGLFMPWVSESATGSMIDGTIRGAANGYQLNQGLIGAGVALVGAVLGFLGSRETIPRRTVGFLVAFAGLVIVVVSGALVVDPPSGASFALPAARANLRLVTSLEIGVWISLVGGILLLVGGMLAVRRSE